MSTNESTAELQQGGRSVLGVHLDIDSLRLVEVARGRIANWASVPYPAGLAPTAKEFPAFLKSSLAGYNSTFRRSALWVVGSLPSLQVRFLALPKARPRQMSHLVYWTFRKEIPFDAAQTIFDYDLEGDLAAAGAAKKIDATAYTVAQAEVDALVDVFARAGLAVDGVLIPSFALRNLLRNQPTSHAGPVLGLYVGEDSSALLFYKGKHVVAHRVFKTGLNAISDVLRDRHPTWSPAKTYQMIADSLAAAAFNEENRAPAADATGESREIGDTVRLAFDRLVQQVERSMSAYLVGRSDEEIRTLYVAGPMAGLPALVKELGAKLGLACQPLNLFQPALLDAKTTPPRPEEAGMLALALGAALSDAGRTPNLLHTYVKRLKEAHAARLRLAGAILGAAGLALLVAAGTLVGKINRGLMKERDVLRTQIAQYRPAPDRAMIEAMVAQATVDSRQLKNMAGRSLPVAALNRLASQTPADVRLTTLTLERADASNPAAARKGGADSEAEGAEVRLHVEGTVLGPPGAQESKLAAYVLRLENCGMFTQVVQLRSEEGRDRGDQVLLFALDLKMNDLVGAPPPAAAAAEKGAAP